MRLAFIDHYDSFSKNIVSWLESADFEVDHVFFDSIPSHYLEKCSTPLVISPGPGTSSDYLQSLGLIEKSLGKVPILGICLGHQILGQLAGFEIRRSHMVWHGHAREVSISNSSGLFQTMPDRLKVSSYNSLCLDHNSHLTPLGWSVTARNLAGEIEAIENWQVSECPAMGIQFHPESFLSQDLSELLSNWKRIITKFKAAQSRPY